MKSALGTWLDQRDSTVYCSAPTVFSHFIDSLGGDEKLSRVRLVRLIGEPVYRRHVELFRRYFDNQCVLVNRLGSTETGSVLFYLGSSHKCMHDFAPGRSATAVGRRCGCARAGTQRCSRLSLSRRPPARAPLLVGGPARRQPDQTQAADAMALTWRRTEKASGRGLDFRRRSTLEPNPSLTVQPPLGTGSPVTIQLAGVAGSSGSLQLLPRYRRCSSAT